MRDLHKAEIFFYYIGHSFLLNAGSPYLAVWLAAYNFHSVPLLLCCALLQLVGPKESHPVHVGAVTALRGRHEGGRNQQNLKQTGRD